jgi:putative ribosome biogenesis GTPase RsgA
LAELEKLEKALLSSRELSGRQKIYVLHGLGGMGKTQLVVEFAGDTTSGLARSSGLTGCGQNTARLDTRGEQKLCYR